MFPVDSAGAANRVGQGFFAIVRWLLMAFVAIVLLSPIWKMFATFVGTLDKWIWLFVLLAIAALVFRRPFAFAIFLIISLLVHRGGNFLCRHFGVICLARRLAHPRLSATAQNMDCSEHSPSNYFFCIVGVA